MAVWAAKSISRLRNSVLWTQDHTKTIYWTKYWSIFETTNIDPTNLNPVFVLVLLQYENNLVLFFSQKPQDSGKWQCGLLGVYKNHHFIHDRLPLTWQPANSPSYSREQHSGSGLLPVCEMGSSHELHCGSLCRYPSANLLRGPAATSGESHLETLARFTSLAGECPYEPNILRKFIITPGWKGNRKVTVSGTGFSCIR